MFNQLPCTCNGYVFKRILGKGGFSTVYLVESTKFPDCQYVAKVTQISSEPLKEGDFDACDVEIKALMLLSHQNIIKLYDHFNCGQNFVMILEYCPKGSLQNKLTIKNGLPLPQFLSYAKQILSALAFCHSKEIAHRDIKPGNILIDATGRIKLSDFGISIINANNLTNSFSGSLIYEPPEIINKVPHNPMQADIWSLGVLFAYMINGCTPWRCNNIGVLKSRICSGTYRLRSSTPPEVANIIKKMIVVDPNKRITAQELLNEPLFKNVQDTCSIGTSLSMEDLLSPRGRATNKTVKMVNLDGHKFRNINIFRLGLSEGNSFLPKLKPRYHQIDTDPSATV
jgi:serine/threonine protein kinase